MRVLEALASAFIRTFGITQPSDKMLRQASWFILGMLSLVAVGLVAAAFLLMRLL